MLATEEVSISPRNRDVVRASVCGVRLWSAANEIAEERAKQGDLS
jgi:hypothetical protein